ncbi:MAG TPA: hypothetical protein VKM55_10200 [Candidatus Lokiarchaeia archaeon]|nr:hypothetical protein [Candidatus Lokiarchaeia archaeon]
MSDLERYLPIGEKVLWQSEVLVSNEAAGERRVRIGCAITIGILMILCGYYVAAEVVPIVSTILSSGPSLASFGVFIGLLLWIVVFASFFISARVSWRMYAKLRAWYPVKELAHYEQFLAITEKHIIRKSIQVASRASITGVPFPTFVEEGPDFDPRRSTSWVPRHVIMTEKDVQTMDISALARVQNRKMYRNSFLVNLSFHTLDAPEMPESRNLVAHTRLLVKARDMDDFITILRTLNPTFIIEDQVSIKAMMNRD